MNAKHRKTLTAIFKDPTPKQLEWKAIEALLIAVGADIIEGRGSRVRFYKDGEIGTFHRPHPKKEAKPYQVHILVSLNTHSGSFEHPGSPTHHPV